MTEGDVPVDIKKAKAILEYFNEKVEKLHGLSFTSSIFNDESGVQISWEKDSGILQIERNGPDEESIDAFVLTFRLFIQDNDEISLRNMAPFIDSLPIKDENKNNFKQTRRCINEFLDSETSVTLNDKKLTRREIMNVFIYGGLSHGTQRDKFLQWRKMEMIFPILYNEFVVTISEFLNGIYCMRNNNIQILEELSSN